MTDYEHIEQAIVCIRNNFRDQPQLELVAGEVHLSPFHFQRLFTKWAGISPKKFLQYTSVTHAKKLLRTKPSLLDASLQTGLSGTGRLHDLFVSIEGMTPGEFRKGGAALTITYTTARTRFGKMTAAATGKGICYMAYTESECHARSEMEAMFPQARLVEASNAMLENAVGSLRGLATSNGPIPLHLQGTPFQLKVWKALLRIPFGGLSTYGAIAESMGQPLASRAVGTAVGSNPVACIIPCHRVIRSDGTMGGYHWGEARKTALLGWEAGQVEIAGR